MQINFRFIFRKMIKGVIANILKSNTPTFFNFFKYKERIYLYYVFKENQDIIARKKFQAFLYFLS